MKEALILVASNEMDSNRKDARNEHELIRMGQKARYNLDLANDKTVELWPDSNSDEDRINRSRVLKIFNAYSADLKKAKEAIPCDKYLRVGFVTSNTFSYICRDSRKKKENIWLADKISDTFIGGDPEFALFTQDSHIRYAAEVLNFSDALGSDGPLAELRPEPAVEVNKFVENIQKILRGHPNTRLIEDLDWTSGCVYEATRAGTGGSRDWPIGGHIHIGTPMKLSKKMESIVNGSNGHIIDGFMWAIFACLNKSLDEMLAVPMIKIDGKENTIRRRRSQYGKFGEFKRDRGRLEYRTISGEWLSHPKMATAVLGTAKAIAHAYFLILEEGNFDMHMVMTDSKHKSITEGEPIHHAEIFSRDFVDWKNIPIMKEIGAVSDSGKLIDILSTANIEFTKGYYGKLSRTLRSLPTYQEYSSYIDLFLEIVALPYEAFRDMDRNLKHTWVGKSDFII